MATLGHEFVASHTFVTNKRVFTMPAIFNGKGKAVLRSAWKCSVAAS